MSATADMAQTSMDNEPEQEEGSKQAGELGREMSRKREEAS
jgi:hypothetical protein